MSHIKKDTSWLDGRWEQTDRRRDLRRQWDQLVNLSKYLDDKERVFVEAVAEQGGRITRLARLTRRSPTSLRRQLHDITRRLLSRELRVLIDHPHVFSGFEKACLREHHIRKHSLPHIAQELGATVYQVRKGLTSARAKVTASFISPNPVR